jgi:hypothetical protein
VIFFDEVFSVSSFFGCYIIVFFTIFMLRHTRVH